MSDTYNDFPEMRDISKEEQEAWNELMKNITTPIEVVNKEKYDRLKEAFLNIMADSECYCNNLAIYCDEISGYDQCYYCEYKDLRKQLMNEDGDSVA